MPDDAAVQDLLPFTMPSLGADMDEGTVLEWLVAPGAQVHHGDVVAVVQTDKSDLDVEVFDDGIVAELVVPVGVKVPVGTVLARLRPLGTATQRPPAAAPPAVAPPAAKPAAAKPAAAPPAAAAPAVAPAGAAEPHVSSPVLRHLAERLHVDLDAVHGTGAGGRITRDDIEHAVAPPTIPQPQPRAPSRPAEPPSGAAPGRRVSPRARRLAREHKIDVSSLGAGMITGDAVLDAATAGAPAPPAPVPPAPAPPAPAPPAPAMDAMRVRIGRLMTKAWQEIPHYQVASRIDLSSCLASLAELNASRPAAARILPAAVLARAAARAAAAVPEVNGHWVAESFVPGEGVHLAVVVALRSGGLLAPVIHDAADKDIDTLMSELRDLVTRARAGRLRASEVTGATITVTELGEGGVESVSPIIHPPQVAILGLGSIIDQPWAEHGMVGVRPVVHATLAGDHRAVDGRLGSLFLTRLSAFLQEPLQS